MELLLAIVGFALYMAPWGVASMRRHQNSAAIGVLNFLLGWTVIGWIGALVWAATAVDPTRQRPKAQFGSLLDPNDPHMPQWLRNRLTAR